MRPFILAFVAALFVSALGIDALTDKGEAQPVQGDGLEVGIDRPGSDYRSFWMAAHDPRSCQAVCDRDRQCAAFTFARAGVQGPLARCYLKNAVPAAANNNCCVSGVAGGSHEPQFDRPGADFVRMPLPSGGPQACRRACRLNSRCRAYTYVDAGVQGPQPICYLKDQVPDPVPHPRTTSGVMS